jgi:hypothetical protein
MTNKDYIFIERSPDETSYVKLVGENEWNGTIFQYGQLRIKVDETKTDDDMAHLEFNYNIIESPLRTEMLEHDINFKNYIGMILEQIITEALDNGEYKLGSQDSDNSIKESDKQ